jgi:Flp pilus assembly protein TadG
MKLKSVPLTSLRMPRAAVDLFSDTEGMGAVEFALIVPIMLTAFFGLVEYSSVLAVDRKVTLVARTLSDLTSQSVSVTSNDLKNFFAASSGILTPYTVVPVQPSISEIYIDASKVAKIQWSAGATVAMVNGAAVATLAGTPPHAAGTVVTVPSGLLIPKTYLIWSEVKYQYKPTVGYVMGIAGLPLNDATFTRPRQVQCVEYAIAPCATLP